MNLQEEILKIKNEMIDEFDKRVEALKVDEQEFPQDDDNYWFIDSTGEVLNDESWEGLSFEKDMLEIGNVFKTKDQAEFVVEKLKVEAELRKYSKPFKRDTLNFIMCFDTDEDKICRETKRLMVQGAFYFENIYQLDKAIETVGEERIKKYIFGVKE